MLIGRSLGRFLVLVLCLMLGNMSNPGGSEEPKPSKAIRKQIKSRQAYLAHLGKIQASFSELTDRPDATQVITLSERLNSTVGKINDLNDEIYELLDEDDISEELNEQNRISDVIAELKAKLSFFLPGTENAKRGSPVDSVNVVGSLPKLQLPKFRGDYLEWRSFYDQFSAAVGSKQIPDVDKLIYLSSSREGKAKTAIVGLSRTAANYPVALEILKDRFGDPSLLITLYSEKIVNLKPVPENHPEIFREVLDSFESCLREIKNLTAEVSGVSCSKSSSSAEESQLSSSTSAVDLLLAPLFVGKLPSSVQLEWSRRSPSPKDKFDLEKLLAFSKKGDSCFFRAEILSPCLQTLFWQG